ncbi:unnamed protein product, partial [Staurois parvus]
VYRPNFHLHEKSATIHGRNAGHRWVENRPKIKSADFRIVTMMGKSANLFTDKKICA